MPKDENRHAGLSATPGSSEFNSNHDVSSGGFQPSPELRDKFIKLANRRIDLPSIEFVNGAREFRGGNATVSRAVLVSPSSSQDSISQSNPIKEDGLDSPDPAGKVTWQRKDVAVKKMKISDNLARVLGLTLREAEFLVQLSHENVIKLEGFVEDLSKDVVWLVFPWAENGNLKNFIASAEWEIPERIWLIDGVARGVEYLHSQKPPIRHGDLKSINILVNSEYCAVITDFGSARRLTAKDLERQTSQTKCQPHLTPSLETTVCAATNTNTINITLTGDQYTLRWAAPELLRDGEGTLESDIWALGWVAYEVMTNSIPFQDVARETVVIVRVIRGDLPSVTESARMSLIRALCSLMLACWSSQPTKRPTAENCRKSINWMPMIRPNPMRTAGTAGCREPSPALRMQLGGMYRRQGDYVNASDSFTKALSSYEEVDDSKGRVVALVELAQVYRLQNEYTQAVTLYSEALLICTDTDDGKGRADALWGLAEVYRARDEYNQAITFYSEVLQICTDVGDRNRRASALQGLAEVHRARAEYTQAITFYSEALEIRTDIGDREGRASALWGLAEVHRSQDEYTQAMIFYSEALQLLTDVGDKHGRASVLWGLAEVHGARAEYTQAIPFYSEAIEICTEIGDRKVRASALWGLAEAHRLRNKHSQAIAFFSEALEICTDIDNRKVRASVLCSLAELHRAREEYTQAITLYSEALQICTDIGDRQGRADALWGLAGLLRARGDYFKAITFFSEALEVCIDIGNQSGRAHALSGLGDVHHDQGNYRDAVGPYTEAAEVFEQIGDTQNAAYASNHAAKARVLCSWWPTRFDEIDL